MSPAAFTKRTTSATATGRAACPSSNTTRYSKGWGLGKGPGAAVPSPLLLLLPSASVFDSEVGCTDLTFFLDPCRSCNRTSGGSLMPARAHTRGGTRTGTHHDGRILGNRSAKPIMVCVCVCCSSPGRCPGLRSISHYCVVHGCNTDYHRSHSKRGAVLQVRIQFTGKKNEELDDLGKS